MAQSPSNDMEPFRKLLAASRKLVVLTGAGVSAESGVPTFRGAGGYWRKYNATMLATPESFDAQPSLVWEFYHYRRELMLTKQPNAAHIALAKYEKYCRDNGRKMTLITQNIDSLHARAGSQNIVELHGNLFMTRCLKCGDVRENTDSPICEALRDTGVPDPEARAANIPEKLLPRCKVDSCNGLLRPHVVWFGENLESSVLESAHQAMDECDLCLLVGTSSVVYPAAGFAPDLAARGVPVAEFNMESTPATHHLKFHFEGPAGTTLKEALAIPNIPQQ